MSKKAKAVKTKPLFNYTQDQHHVKETYSPMKIGAIMLHSQYGEGVVGSCDEQKITLIFPEGEKQLNYPYCMTKGLLQSKA